jgi:hypothetical protein
MSTTPDRLTFPPVSPLIAAGSTCGRPFQFHAGSAETRVDWRAAYCDLAYSRPALPDDVRHGLVRYCLEFGLAYGAFDLVVTPDGGWVFLECNASGQYGWIEDAIGAPITAAIADLLVAGRTP